MNWYNIKIKYTYVEYYDKIFKYLIKYYSEDKHINEYLKKILLKILFTFLYIFTHFHSNNSNLLLCTLKFLTSTKLS